MVTVMANLTAVAEKHAWAKKNETYESDQSAWEEAFGENFLSAEAHTFAIGASPDGLRVGFEFHRNDGQVSEGIAPGRLNISRVLSVARLRPRAM